MAGMGAFWKFGLGSSKIDTILNKKEFTLEELLDEEDILQECRQATKDKLTEFLAKPEQIKALLDYVINEPSEEIDERQRFKYSNIASEVLTSECWAIMDALCQPAALDLLWSTLDKPQPLNPLLTSLFSKVVTMLLSKEVEMLTKYIIEHPDLPDKLISHMATPAIKDIIHKMTTIESGDSDGEEMSLDRFWSDDAKLISILVGLFNTSKSGASDAVLSNVAELMEDLINDGRKEAIEMQEFSTPLPFLRQIINEDTLKELLGYMFDPDNSPTALKCGLDLINVMLTELERGEDEAPPTAMDNTRHTAEISRVMIALIPFVEKMNSLLYIKPTPLTTASGPLNPPLGVTRLNAARTFEALVATKNDAVDAEIIKLNCIPVLLDLFATYTENNFLHAYVLSIVSNIMSSPPLDSAPERKAPLHAHLFKECDIVGRCMTLFRMGTTNESGRLGYMGHVIKMCNALQASTGRDGDGLKLYFGETAEGEMAKADTWAAFVTETLTAANDQQSSTFEHRPPMNTGFSSEEPSDDEYDGTEMMANATLQYGRYLTERISVEIPDDYGVDDDDDDDDEKDDIAESYGNSGAFSADINYSTDVTVQASAVDNWRIVDGEGNALGKPLVAFADTTITLSTDGDGGDEGVDQEGNDAGTDTTTNNNTNNTTKPSLTTNADDAFEAAFGNTTTSEDPFADSSTPSALSDNGDPFTNSNSGGSGGSGSEGEGATGGSEGDGVTVQGIKLSETISFDKIIETSTPKEPSEGWAPFGATLTLTQTQSLSTATTAVADAVMTSVMSQVTTMDDVADDDVADDVADVTATDEKLNDNTDANTDGKDGNDDNNNDNNNDNTDNNNDANNDNTNNNDVSNDNNDDDRDDPLPELPDSTTTSPEKTMVIDGTTDNIESESNTDDVDAARGNEVLDIEGGGHLFGSAV